MNQCETCQLIAGGFRFIALSHINGNVEHLKAQALFCPVCGGRAGRDRL